jgi:hypothetical protein
MSMPMPVPPGDDDRLVALERENRSLQERLRRAELILAIQDKTRQLLGVFLGPRREEPPPASPS